MPKGDKNPSNMRFNNIMDQTINRGQRLMPPPMANMPLPPMLMPQIAQGNLPPGQVRPPMAMPPMNMPQIFPGMGMPMMGGGMPQMGQPGMGIGNGQMINQPQMINRAVPDQNMVNVPSPVPNASTGQQPKMKLPGAGITRKFNV